MSKQPPLNESLYTLFYGALQSSGNPIDINKLDQLRTECDKMAQVLLDSTKTTSINLIQKLQEAIYTGFESYGKDLETIEHKLTRLDQEIKKIKTSFRIK